MVSQLASAEPDSVNLQRVSRFWRNLGCEIVEMSSEEHDRILALTSHLPHVMASVTTTAVGEQNLGLTGAGFRDTTRVAAGDAALWRAILAGNRKQVIAAIERAEQLLCQYREALEQQNDGGVQQLLDAAASCRMALDSDVAP